LLGSLWFKSFSAGGGGDAAYELISTTVLSTGAASVTFSSLNTGVYKHLQLRIAGRSSTNSDTVTIRFNADSGTNYSWHQLYGNGSVVGSSSTTSTTWTQGGYVAGTDSASNIFGVSIVDILDPFATTKNKTVRVLTGVPDSNNLITLRSGAWYNTAAVTSLVVGSASGNNFATGSRFSLYGLRGA